MKFQKVQGLGNDFILVDGFQEELPVEIHNAAKKLCDRHFGIGADGLVIALPSDKADVRMRIINSDGSEAEMCGNAIRCFARFVREAGYVSEDEFSVETQAGIMTPRLIRSGGVITGVRVDMGEPKLSRGDVPMLGQAGQAVDEPLEAGNAVFNITALLMGVPHCVTFVDDVDAVELEKYGPLMEKHPLFPRKTNVHFLQVVNDSEIRMRVWERGAGVTMACGTGACAALVAANLNKKTGRKAKVHLPGGTLEIEWADNNHVYMTGPAELVYTGEIKLK